jgi:glycosyltransferase involved in cell wall biosynthesis
MNSGGIGSFVQFLSRKLVKQGIKVSIVGLNNNNSYDEDHDLGVNIFRVPKSKWKFGKFYQHTKRILSKIEELSKIEKVDIVEGSELNFAFFPKKAAYKKVIRLHGGHHFFALELGEKNAFWRSYQERKSFSKADAYIAVSNYVGKQTQKYLKYNFPFRTIFNSVNTDKFKPDFDAKVEENSLLFVGTICEKKGIKQLIQAIPIIKKQIPNIQLNIVGRDWKFKDGSSYIEYLQSTFCIDFNIEGHTLTMSQSVS